MSGRRTELHARIWATALVIPFLGFVTAFLLGPSPKGKGTGPQAKIKKLSDTFENLNFCPKVATDGAGGKV